MKISNENLDVLIEGLTEYKKNGVVDPWVLDDGERIEPLDVLIELRLRRELPQKIADALRRNADNSEAINELAFKLTYEPEDISTIFYD